MPALLASCIHSIEPQKLFGRAMAEQVKSDSDSQCHHVDSKCGGACVPSLSMSSASHTQPLPRCPHGSTYNVAVVPPEAVWLMSQPLHDNGPTPPTIPPIPLCPLKGLR